MKAIAKNPAITNLIVTIIFWLGAKYGFSVSDQTATAIAGAVLVIGTGLVRQFVTPLADPKDNNGNKLVPVNNVTTPKS